MKRTRALLGSNPRRDNSTDWNGPDVLLLVARSPFVSHSKNLCLKKSIALVLSHSFFKKDEHLGVCQLPSTHWEFPVFLKVSLHQVQQFKQGHIRGKNTFAFGNLPQLTVKRLNDVGCVNNSSDLLRILEVIG